MRYLWVWNHVSGRLIMCAAPAQYKTSSISIKQSNRDRAADKKSTGLVPSQDTRCLSRSRRCGSTHAPSLPLHALCPPAGPMLATSVIGTLFNCLCFRFSICFEFFGHAMWANKASLISPNMHESCPKLGTRTCSRTENWMRNEEWAASSKDRGWTHV